RLRGEAAVMDGASERGVPFVIGRFHNVYGPRMGADHVIPELCLRALDGCDPFAVYGVEQRRAFCHVADAVDAITGLMDAERAAGQIVNVGNDTDEPVTGALAALIWRLAGVSPRIERHSAPPPGSVDRRCPDLTRLRSLTGFVPKVSLDAGVSETLTWYRAWRAQRGRGR